ncbi:MAG: FHA domain-containing protein [Acidimicrobiia bacterium]
MSESLLTVLKFCFLALLYLFLLRVVRVVALELRSTAPPADLAPAPGESHEEPAPKGTWALKVLEPPARAGEHYPVTGEVTVGRAGGCSLVLADDTFVSQVHARVFPRNGRLWVEDLGSTNGTFVNGTRVTQATRVRRGDHVQFGRTLVEVMR